MRKDRFLAPLGGSCPATCCDAAQGVGRAAPAALVGGTTNEPACAGLVGPGFAPAMLTGKRGATGPLKCLRAIASASAPPRRYVASTMSAIPSHRENKGRYTLPPHINYSVAH